MYKYGSCRTKNCSVPNFNISLFTGGVIGTHRCFGKPSLCAFLFNYKICDSDPQYKYPLKAQKTGRAGLQRPSLDICVWVTSRTPGLLWCVRAAARGTRWGLLLFLTLKGESEKSLTLRWSQSRLKIAANYPHMCCSGKNITDRRLHFISNALSHVTAVLFKLMKVQQREKEEVEQEFTGSLGTNCYF